MILTDREIKSCLKSGQIEIDPVPAETSYSATTVDLTLGTTVQEWIIEGESVPTIYPARPGYKLADVLEQHTQRIDISDGYIIRPQQFILAWTAERIVLPNESKIAARVEGKSSLARIAIGVHICAPTIHPGFQSVLQLEMCNHGTVNVEIRPGMKICQLIFEMTMGTPDQGYDGQFRSQSDAKLTS